MATEAPVSWLTHYPGVLRAYLTRGEAGLEAIEERLRTEAASRPGGKFGKTEAAYVPFTPIPPVDWRHDCGHCRFWVDHGPGKAGECMIVGREGDPFGGKAIHEDAGCAYFMPPAGERVFDWIREQWNPTGADLVRGEFHREGLEGVSVPVTDEEGTRREPEERAPRGTTAGRAEGERTEAERTADERQAERRPSGRRSRLTSRGRTSTLPAGPTVGVETVARGLAAPVSLSFDPGEPERAYVADQRGHVRVLQDGDLRATPLLDLTDRIVDLETQYDERGLLGLALHPEFADNERLFVRYSAPPRGDTPADYDHTGVLAEFRLEDADGRIDPETERSILEIPHPAFNHNAGPMAFGPDGHLYVTTGDGGGEGDRGFGHVPGGNGQDVTENLLGSVLRIDVDDAADGAGATATGADAADGRPYGIPDDNPLVGEDGRDEHYAWGFRNPWGLSFDADGRLFVADVGQHLFEEVDVVERGGNYGWNVREGFHCFDPDAPSDPPEDCPETSERGEPLRDPILEYPHVTEEEVVGSAVVGGHVYEGDAIPDLSGAYVFGDWATSQDRPSGRLFAARDPGGAGADRWRTEELAVAGRADGRLRKHVLGFARGRDGELYVLTNETHVPKGKTGAVQRLVPP